MRGTPSVWVRSVARSAIRDRYGIQDLTFIAATMLVAGYLAFEYDLFAVVRPEASHGQGIELNEVFLLGALLTFGLLVFAWRRLNEARQETERRAKAEAKARELALQDPLTGLANRRQFDDALSQAIGSPPAANTAHALLLLDLNGFKQINDLYGHGAGDETLVVVAQRLLAGAREADVVARLGGDEFAILALHVAGGEAAGSIARRVIDELNEPIMLGGGKREIGVSIGICLLPFDEATGEEVLRRADIALYRAKEEHTSTLRFFDAEMDRQIRERDRMEQLLREAVAKGEIRPRYQPLVDLKTKAVVEFELLAHWEDPSLGVVPRERFIPIAEDCGLLPELTDQLLGSACRTARAWPSQVKLSFNVTAAQLKDPGFGLRVLGILGQSGLPGDRLEIEITEAVLVRDFDAAQKALGPLRGSGVRLTLDSFGAGYSSLYHLRNFKLDKIKIDESFVRAMGSKSESAAIVKGLVGLGRGLGLTISAEGVSDRGQEEALLATGCDQAQGRFFGQEVSPEDTASFFQGSAASAG